MGGEDFRQMWKELFCKPSPYVATFEMWWWKELHPCKRNDEHCCPLFQKLIWVVLLVVVKVMVSPPVRARMLPRRIGKKLCIVGWSTSLSFRRGGRELEANALVAFSSQRIRGDVVEVVGIQSGVGVCCRCLCYVQVQARNNPRLLAPAG